MQYFIPWALYFFALFSNRCYKQNVLDFISLIYLYIFFAFILFKLKFKENEIKLFHFNVIPELNANEERNF